ncbi:hypothetical protein [Meiothermus granaticius]|uniref:Uncharacterized protein n=1 Tax=Meiothermus granaticius NBRC 107808 TaxID=1227551 RepID=A0A399FCS4_9DEIN|nr:hypothetical protein [Meiothermus granaticius]RIH93566.1 hypothetical protein Mgrana_00390 [Meiothermus granaticius NBRC 107808]GEM87204.1 hypothetical protein MGR01S_18290 [Meiothermus granaticius NBRC 107808]
MELSIAQIKSGIVLLWALWLSLVTLMNGLEALKALGSLPSRFKTSSNWSLMLRVTETYRTPVWLVGVLFALVILWELLTSVALWVALFSGSPEVATTALGLLTLLWGGFMLANQFYMAWLTDPGLVAAHRSLFGVSLLSLLAYRLL